MKWLRCREQSLAEGFETAYNVLRSQFLAVCGTAVAEAASWQAAEAALMAIRCSSPVPWPYIPVFKYSHIRSLEVYFCPHRC